jgi:hypothetical protein
MVNTTSITFKRCMLGFPWPCTTVHATYSLNYACVWDLVWDNTTLTFLLMNTMMQMVTKKMYRFKFQKKVPIPTIGSYN